MSKRKRLESIPDFVFDNLDVMREKRKAMNLTKQQLADNVGLSANYINNFECAYQLPTRENYNKLAKVFDWRIWL